MKRFFLVDLENVGKNGLAGINKLGVEDVIFIFHNEELREELPEFIETLLKHTPATTHVYRLKSHAKNGMDFHICMKLGELCMANGNTSEYYVVSNDKGFDCCNYYRDNMGIKTNMKRIESFDVYCECKQEEELVRELLKDFPKAVIRRSVKGFCSTITRHEYHTFLQKNLKEDYKKVLTLRAI